MNYLKFIIFLLFCGICHLVDAQQITYMNQDWEVVKNKSEATYYREARKEGKCYHIKDFYMNGTLQMEGYSINNDPTKDILDGKVTWYNEQGKVYNIANYDKGVQHGVYQFYDTNGTLLTDMVYNNGEAVSGYMITPKRKGKDDEFHLNPYDFKLDFLGKGKTKYTTYDGDINGIRKVAYMTDVIDFEKQEFYNEKGQKIAEATYQNYLPKGKVVDYFYEPMRIKSIETYDDYQPQPNISEQFYKNGNKKSFFSTISDKEAKEIFYDKQGKQMAVMYYEKTPADLYPIAYDGVRVNFYEEDEDAIQSIITLKKGSYVREEFYHPNGKLKSIQNFDESGSPLDETYFDENGT